MVILLWKPLKYLDSKLDSDHVENGWYRGHSRNNNDSHNYSHSESEYSYSGNIK